MSDTIHGAGEHSDINQFSINLQFNSLIFSFILQTFRILLFPQNYYMLIVHIVFTSIRSINVDRFSVLVFVFIQRETVAFYRFLSSRLSSYERQFTYFRIHTPDSNLKCYEEICTNVKLCALVLAHTQI